MIYMVDHVFAQPALEPLWHEWYSGYLDKLLSVPGIHSAQRFKAIGQPVARFLAMYSIDSADVYESTAYRGIGGGGSQSVRFHGAYALWTRNLFAGAERAPEISRGQRLWVVDAPRPDPGMPRDLNPLWLQSIGLHMTTPCRALVVLEAGQEDPALDRFVGFVYEPLLPARRSSAT